MRKVFAYDNLAKMTVTRRGFMNTDFPQGTVILTGGAFNFARGNASTNLTIEIAKAHEVLGYVPRMIPQNPSLSREEAPFGTYCDVPYAYPIKGKNIFPGYGGWRDSLNFRFGNFINSLLTGWAIWRNKSNISHVFSQTLRPISLLIIALTCKFSQVRFIYHLVEEPWTLVAHDDTSPWRRVGRMIQEAIPVFLLYVVILRFPSVVACITEELMRLLHKWGYPDKQLFYLPNVRCLDEAIEDRGNCVDRNDLGPSVYSSATPFVVYSGQISHSKEAFEPLLEAVGRVNKSRLRLKLHIYGGGDPYAISRLKRMIVDLDVGEFVKFYGFVSRKELLAAQQATILCLLLKRDVPFNQYNFPTKLMDYLGASKAVLMSNLPLHGRYFTDKIDSLIVNPESVDEIQEALEWALENPSRLEKFGERASRKLHEHFGAVANIKRMLAYAPLPKIERK